MCKPDDLSLSPERAAAAAAAVLPKPSSTTTLSLPPTLRRCSWSSPAQLRWATSTSGCHSSPCGGSVCSGGTPVVVNFAKASPCTPVGGRRRASGAHRPWLFCVAIVALCLEKHLVRKEAQELLRRSTESLGQQQTLLAEEEEKASRDFLKAGSHYQNEYMTLWNGAGVAISVTLKIEANNQFQLLVSHLNSKGRGSEGWFSVKGSFGLRSAGATTAAGSRLSLVQSTGGDDLVFSYDLSVLDRASAVLYRCLDRVGATGMLSVISLEVDPTEDAIYVKPTARIVRALWDEPVVLKLTDKDRIWVPDSAAKKGD